MKLLVVGAGSTGGYFGGRLQQAGRDVTFLVRPRRAEQLRATGLQIRSPHGDVDLVPDLVQADGLDQTYDAIFLTVKAYALDAALADIAPAVGPETMILPILNGMAHIDRLTERFGTQAVIGGLCKCSTTLGEAGEILQLNPMQDLTYGELDGSQSDRIQRLDGFMKGAGFNARLSADIALEMWEKWFFLSSLAGSTCLLRGDTGQINAAPSGTDAVHAIIDEAAAIISAVGIAPRPDYVAGTRAQLTNTEAPLSSSMFRDMQAGLAVEADAIIGDLVHRAKAASLPAPLMTAAFVNLALYDAARQERLI